MSEQLEEEVQLEDIQAHKIYEIPESAFKDNIVEHFDDIHREIEQVNSHLNNLFRNKKDGLINEYKQQMTKAQQKQKELTEQTSEVELKKRMAEKKEILQRERQKFLEESTKLSNDCKKFKESLQKVTATTGNLESEIDFLKEQIVYAQKHNEKLSDELDQMKTKVKQFDPAIDFDEIDKILSLPNKNRLNDLTGTRGLAHSKYSNSKSYDKMQLQRSQLQANGKLEKTGYDKYVSPYNVQAMQKFDIQPQDVERAKEELRKQKEINEKLNEFINDQCFQETEFERIFLESVLSIKNKKNTLNNSISSQKLPQISQHGASMESSIKRANDSTLDYTSLSDFDFNEFGKRQILEEFLSREEIKRYLYSLIFGSQQ